VRSTLYHTPEGVRDRYNEEIARKNTVRNRIISQMHSFGYRDIETPTVEFFDVFNKDRGSVENRDMFKLFDKEGNTLVLRPDITPSIARAVSKYFMDEDMPIRLSYCGNTFYNGSSLQGKMKEVTQLGAELIGDETSDADAEIIAMLINSLAASGLKDFQVEIGHAGFFKGLIAESNLSDEEIEQLTYFYENKNYFGIESLLEANGKVSEDCKKGLLDLTQTFGNIEQIKDLKERSGNKTVVSIIEYLEKVYDILSYYGLEKYVSFDLGILGHYKYYTGIIIQAFTYGTGEMIATGGRYDKLISQFGKDVSSVGFGINQDLLMLALSRLGIEVDTDIYADILLYEREHKKQAIEYALELRKQGRHIQLMKKFHEKSLEDYIEYAKRNFIDKIIYIDSNGNRKVL
jgi:ATP phosphoribosyltransferase regulatory subunit